MDGKGGEADIHNTKKQTKDEKDENAQVQTNVP